MGSHSITFRRGTFRGWDLTVSGSPGGGYRAELLRPGLPTVGRGVAYRATPDRAGYDVLAAAYEGSVAELEHAAGWLIAWVRSDCPPSADRSALLDAARDAARRAAGEPAPHLAEVIGHLWAEIGADGGVSLATATPARA